MPCGPRMKQMRMPGRGVTGPSVVLLAGFVTSSDWVLAHVVGALTGVSALK